MKPTVGRHSCRFNTMHGLCAHCTCLFLNNASARIVHKWLKRKNDHLLTFQIWMPQTCHVWGAMHKAIFKPSTKAQTSFWIKSHTREDMGQFSTGPINKSVPSFRNLRSICEGWRNTFLAFFSTQKYLHLWCLCCLEQLRQFLITSTAKLLWLKAG